MARKLKTREKTQKEITIVFFVSLALLAASVLTIYTTAQGYQEQSIRKNLSENGIITTGIVEEVHVDRITHRRGTSQNVFVNGNFSIDGNSHQFNQGLSGFNKIGSAVSITINNQTSQSEDSPQSCGDHFEYLASLKTGDEIDVIYNPDNPNIARPAREDFNSTTNCNQKNILFTIIFTCLSLLVIYVMMFGKVVKKGQKPLTFKEALATGKEKRKKKK